jgi:3-isopropylmalate/(R)-2-methylmalate dehydratase small subunit
MADPKTEINVDLPNQKVTLLATGESESFVINTYKKDNMLNGFDDIDYLKNIEIEITAFAKTRPF